MAFFDATPDRLVRTDGTGIKGTLSTMFDTPFDRKTRAVSRRIAQLRALDDDQLAGLGLTRDQIIPHVFGTR